MNKILNKNRLAPNVMEFVIDAPLVAKHAAPGQFVIVIIDENGERVPFTICDIDKKNGTITILVQSVGKTTERLCAMEIGEELLAFAGPLGNVTNLSEYKNICLIGGGIGTAVIFPQAKHLASNGISVDVIVGARDKSLIMYEEHFRNNSDNLYIMTDNGSYGEQGFVTNKLQTLIDEGKNYDCVFAVGPVPMMRAVSNLTRTYGIKTIVSMNAIMVDGTGMCGCCRLTVDKKTKYACVDGPEFDGHLVDFDEAINRQQMYKQHQDHTCNLRG